MWVKSDFREGINNKAKQNTFLYDPEHRLLFCRNAKVVHTIFPKSFLLFQVGTSTWLQHFLSLRNLTKEEEENVLQGNFHAEVTFSTLPTIIFQTQGVASFLSRTWGAFNAFASTGYDILFDGKYFKLMLYTTEFTFSWSSPGSSPF